MLRAIAACAALAVLTACAGMEPAGRGAERAPPPPAPTAAGADATTADPGAVVAPGVSAAPAPAPQRAQADANDGDIVVPGQRESQVPPPGGDPRSTGERVEDIRRWDTCVMQVQNAFDRDPMRPQLTSPEEYCSETLGMSSRTAVPDSRLQR